MTAPKSKPIATQWEYLADVFADAINAANRNAAKGSVGALQHAVALFDARNALIEQHSALVEALRELLERAEASASPEVLALAARGGSDKHGEKLAGRIARARVALALAGEE